MLSLEAFQKKTRLNFAKNNKKRRIPPDSKSLNQIIMFELSLIMGISMLTISLTVLFDKKRMEHTLKKILENEGLIFLMAFLNIVFGLAMLSQAHRLSLDLVGLFALVGWLGFLKGITIMWFPKEMMKFSKKQFKKGNLLTVAGVVHLILGSALTYFAWTII